MAKNSITSLRVTLENGIWAFTDPNTDLVREAFVAGADSLCEALAASVGSDNAVTILFSAGKFPDYQVRLDWLRPEMSGNLYTVKSMGNHHVWLCPALLKYFARAPRRIYVQAKP